MPAPMDLIPGSIKVVRRKAGLGGIELATQPTLTEFQEVMLEPGLGVRVLNPGEVGDHLLLIMQFDVLGRRDG